MEFLGLQAAGPVTRASEVAEEKRRALPYCLLVQGSAFLAACSFLRRRLAWGSTLSLRPSLSGTLP